LARRAAALGAEVVGIDPTEGQLETASARGGGVAYARAEAEALPFGAGAFDAVVICLTLEHLEPFEPPGEGAIGRGARRGSPVGGRRVRRRRHLPAPRAPRAVRAGGRGDRPRAGPR